MKFHLYYLKVSANVKVAMQCLNAPNAQGESDGSEPHYVKGADILYRR